MMTLALRIAGLAMSVATAQTPAIAIVDWYGLRDVSAAELQRALAIEPGNPVPERSTEAEARLEAVPGGGGRAAERGLLRGRRYDSLRRHPGSGADRPVVPCPAQRGEVGEDDSLGHAVVHDPAARAIQESFIDLADRYRDQLREVLQDAADAEQRALAAQVLAYATDKPAVVPDLVHALPGLVLLGRIAGLSGDEIFAAFQRGEREAVIEAALEGTASPDSAR